MADDAWIIGPELAERALSIFRSAAGLNDWLILRLAQGRVAARAQSTVIRASGSAPAHRIDDWAIPSSAWNFISLAEDGPKRIALADDLARLTGSFPPGIEDLPYAQRQFECRGLSYSRRDLSAILGPSPKPAEKPSRRGIGGIAPDKERWAEFAAAFAVVVAKDTEIELTDKPAAIYAKVAQFLSDQDRSYYALENVRDAFTLANAWSQGIRINKGDRTN